MPPKKDRKKEKEKDKELEREKTEGAGKPEQPAAPDSEERRATKRSPGKMVTIQSRTAEPLTFSAPGFECRLPPYGTAEVPEAALVVGQLQQFVLQRLVVVKTAPAAPPATGAETPETAVDKGAVESEKTESEGPSAAGTEREANRRTAKRPRREGDLWRPELDEGE